MIEIVAYIVIGLVSMFAAYVAAIVLAMAFPPLGQPFGFFASIIGGFIVIFYGMSWIFGM